MHNFVVTWAFKFKEKIINETKFNEMIGGICSTVRFRPIFPTSFRHPLPCIDDCGDSADGIRAYEPPLPPTFVNFLLCRRVL